MSHGMVLAAVLFLAGQTTEKGLSSASDLPVPVLPAAWVTAQPGDGSTTGPVAKEPSPVTSGDVPKAAPEEPRKAGPAARADKDYGAEEKKADEAKKEPAVLFPGGCEERLYDWLQQFKKDYHLPLSGGAWHWFHENTPDGPNRSGYGIPPNQKGTYFYYLFVDPEMAVNWGPVSKVGIHSETRFRDEDRFRTFYAQQIWTWELYGWAETPVGKFKAGEIWRRFGLDWDGTFWGNVQYYDGFKLNPDYGLSWENTWKVDDNLTMPSFVQFFIHQDGINGTVQGGDPESQPGSHWKNMGIVRLVPTWTFQDKSTLALGGSALVGKIDNVPTLPVPDQIVSAWAVDLTYSKGPFQVFGETLQSYGVINPFRFVSGGPSHQITDVLGGFTYRVGPVTFRNVYSAGFDENPSGWQSLVDTGVEVALTKNVDFYAEYVHWDIFRRGTRIPFEDGIQLVINWRF